MQKYKRWLLAQMRVLDKLYDHPNPNETVWARAANIVHEAGGRAARLGLVDLLERSEEFGVYLEPERAKAFLTTCIGALKVDSDRLLTAPEVARWLKVSPDTVLGWIRAGKLRAADTGRGGVRPRYKIQEQDLETFLASRTKESTPRPAKPRRLPEPERKYFPEC